MSLRWRRRTRGRKHNADAVMGALRDDTQAILAWRRRLPPKFRRTAIATIIDLMMVAAECRMRIEATAIHDGSPGSPGTQKSAALRYYVTWQPTMPSASVSISVGARVVSFGGRDPWKLVVEIPVGAIPFVVAAIQEEIDKP